MTTVDVPPDADARGDQEDDDAPDTRYRTVRRRRRPAPRANFFWRYLFPLVVVGAGLAVLLLWRTGTKTVLDSTDGRVVEVVFESDEPGYEAFVDATPTLLALHTNGGELTGVTFLAQTDLEDGGGAVLLSADLLVSYNDESGAEQGEFLVDAYADGGVDRVEFLAEQLFGYGFDEVVELNAKDMADAMRLVEPLPYLLADDLVVRSAVGDDVWLEAGRWELDADVAADVYHFRNPDEADATRVVRQRAVWESWLESIARADDAAAAVLPFESGLSPFLRSLGLGSALIESPPLEPLEVTPARPPYYVLDDTGTEWIDRLATELVPLPVTARSFVRPTVRLLDGTGDAELRDSLVDDVVTAGGGISVIGNASEFGVAMTVVAYHRDEVIVSAQAIAEALGTNAVFVEAPDQPVDISVTIGLDQVAS